MGMIGFRKKLDGFMIKNFKKMVFKDGIKDKKNRILTKIE